MNPVPTPEPIAALPPLDIWGFLEFIEPIDAPEMLAFQVAHLTVGMGELKRKLERLENELSDATDEFRGFPGDDG